MSRDIIFTPLFLLLQTSLPLGSTKSCCFCSSGEGTLSMLSLGGELPRKRAGSLLSISIERDHSKVSDFMVQNPFNLNVYSAHKKFNHAERSRKLCAYRDLYFAKPARAFCSLQSLQQNPATQERGRSVEALDKKTLFVNESSVFKGVASSQLRSGRSHANAEPSIFSIKMGTSIPKKSREQLQAMHYPPLDSFHSCNRYGHNQSQPHEFANMNPRLCLRGGGHNVYRSRDDRQAPQGSSLLWSLN